MLKHGWVSRRVSKDFTEIGRRSPSPLEPLSSLNLGVVGVSVGVGVGVGVGVRQRSTSWW